MSWTSTYEAVEFGGVALHRMIAETAIESGDWLALIDGPTGQAVTYATLASRVERVAAGLAARGFGAGDVLALSAMAAGGTVTGANPSCTEGELARQLTDSGASVLVTVPSLLSTALSAAVLTDVREVVVLGEAEGATSILELLAADAPVPDVALDPATAVALLPYSSGTTGLPKGGHAHP